MQSIIQIPTFNGNTLNSISQLPELRASTIDHNREMVCIQEHRYHHREENIEYLVTGNGWTFFSASAWKNSVNAVIGRVRMIIGPRT